MVATLPTLRQFTISHPQKIYRAFSISVVAREGTQPFTLPPAKLRALITLYHRSSSFITPATLSRRIDRAFASSNTSNSASTFYTVYQGLQARVARNRERSTPPILAYRNVPLNEFDATTWSGMRGQRQTLISAALWGVHFGGKPSLETVQETTASNGELGNMLDQTVCAHRL